MTTIWNWDAKYRLWVLVRSSTDRVGDNPSCWPESPQIEWCVITDGREIYL
jgi:hypothetical protein